MVFLRHALRGKPIGPFPTKFLSKNRTKRSQPIITRRGAKRACFDAFFIGKMRDKNIGISFFVFDLQIGFCCIAAITQRIDPQHINCWLTFDNPFSKLPSGTASRGNAKTMAFIQPEIWQIPCRPNNRVAIRRIGNRTIINPLYPRLAKGRNTVHRRLDMRLKPF